jgi:hypothetical protein
VSIKIKVRATSETVLDDVEIQHQRRRDRLVRKVPDCLPYDRDLDAHGYDQESLSETTRDLPSSLRRVLICPIQLIGLKKRIRLGVSSSETQDQPSPSEVQRPQQ